MPDATFLGRCEIVLTRRQRQLLLRRHERDLSGEAVAILRVRHRLGGGGRYSGGYAAAAGGRRRAPRPGACRRACERNNTVLSQRVWTGLRLLVHGTRTGIVLLNLP